MKYRWVVQSLNSQLQFGVKLNASMVDSCSKTSKYLLNHVDMSSLLSICGRRGILQLGSSVHGSVVKRPEFFDCLETFVFRDAIVVWNSLLASYSKCGVLDDAIKLFEDMPDKDTISWNTIISGYIDHEEFSEGFGFFKQMRVEGHCDVDQATITTLLSACNHPTMRSIQVMIHCLVIHYGLEYTIPVGNALITAYFKGGSVKEGKKVFDEMSQRNVVTWTAVISGLTQSGTCRESLSFFVGMNREPVQPNVLTISSCLMACSALRAVKEASQLHALVWKKGMNLDMCIESTLMDMYSKCRKIEDSWKIFESAKHLDEVSLTVILSGLAQNDFEQEATQIFLKVPREGFNLDPYMVSVLLGVLSSETSSAFGKQIHSKAIKKCFDLNTYVNNGLINVYSKSGNLTEAMKIFRMMPKRNLVSWNSIISAYARHGDGNTVLQLYQQMQKEGVEPTDVTFLSLLHGCSHAGLVDKGMEFIKSMTEVYGIKPRKEHFSSIVDMMGRAGLVNEVLDFIEGLPDSGQEPYIWQALLGACGMNGATQLGKYAAKKLMASAQGRPAPYLLMATMLSVEGRWREKAEIIEKMKEMGVARDGGLSWTEK